MLAMAARTTQACLGVGAAFEFRVGACVAAETDLALLCRGLFPKRKHCAATAAGTNMGTDVAVAVDAGEGITGSLAPFRGIQ